MYSVATKIGEQELRLLIAAGESSQYVPEISTYLRGIDEKKALAIFQEYGGDSFVASAAITSGIIHCNKIFELVAKKGFSYCFCQAAFKSPSITSDGVGKILKNALGGTVNNPDKLCLIDGALKSGKLSLKWATELYESLEYADSYYKNRVIAIIKEDLGFLS